MADFKRTTSPIYKKVILAFVLILTLSSLYASAYVQIDRGQATLSGVMSGTSGLEKSGAGSVILSAINTYTGTTIVSTGELLINGTNSGLGEQLIACFCLTAISG